jgi:putative GTP pyrophosphokinase
MTKRTRARNVPDLDAAVEWYARERPVYEALCEKVAGIIERALHQERIDYHSVPYRAKDVESYRQKAHAKRYSDPRSQVHDLAGIRVIAYVDSEAKRAASLVRELFEIDEENSVDKSAQLGVDRVGYRGVHYVATLGHDRCALPELKEFSGLKFEIQVRTILGHAWAEINHDRNYKFAGELPGDIKRRFAILAGTLEVTDREFDMLASDIVAYAGSVARKTSTGQLDIPIDTVSLREYLLRRLRPLVDAAQLAPTFHVWSSAVVDEMRTFGISTLAEFDSLIPDDFVSQAYAHYPNSGRLVNFAGVVRDILIIADPARYFQACWKHRWGPMSSTDAAIWSAFGVDLNTLPLRLKQG